MREPTGTRRSTDVPRSGLARDRVQIDVPKIEKRSQNQTANERVLIGLGSWVALREPSAGTGFAANFLFER